MRSLPALGSMANRVQFTTQKPLNGILGLSLLLASCEAATEYAMRLPKSLFQFSTKQLLIGILLASIICVGGVKISKAIARKRHIDALKQRVTVKASHEPVTLEHLHLTARNLCESY